MSVRATTLSLVCLVGCAPSDLPGPSPAPTPSPTGREDAVNRFEVVTPAASHTSPEASDQPQVREQTAKPPNKPEPTPEPKPENVDAPEPRAQAQASTIRARTWVSKQADPGLAEFANNLASKGSVWVGNLKGNGDRSVLVYIPQNPKPEADVQLIYHFHGTYSEHIEPKADGVPKKRWVGSNRLAQTLEAIADGQQAGPHNLALIYPLSAGKRKDPEHQGWWNGAYDRLWMADIPGGTDRFETLHREVVDLLTQKIGVHPTKILPRVIAEGHSAGGIALRNVAESGTKRVGEYIFLDASFQSWSDRCYLAAQQHDPKAFLTLVITDKGIADPFGKRDPWCARLEAWDQQWDNHQASCQKDPGATPPGQKQSCEELATASEEWEEYRQWCTEMKSDMKNLKRVYVHRTKVPHGEQPRRFSGGLELPPDRRKRAG